MIIPVTRLGVQIDPSRTYDGTVRRVEDVRVRLEPDREPLQPPEFPRQRREQTARIVTDAADSKIPLAGLQTLTLDLAGRTVTRSFVVVRDADKDSLLLRLDPDLAARDQINLAAAVLGRLQLRGVKFVVLPMTPGQVRGDRRSVCAEVLVRFSWEGGDLGRVVRALNLIRDGLAQLRGNRNLPPRNDDPFGSDPWYGPDPDSDHDLVMQAWPPPAETAFDSAKAQQQRQDIGANADRGHRLRNLPIIAVLDTGVAQHPELNLMLPGYNLVTGRSVGRQPGQEPPADPFDGRTPPATTDPLTGHGTGVAVLAAGKESGVARGARVLPVTVCDPQGRCRASDVARGVCYALAQSRGRGDLVINLSLGGSTPSLVLERTLQHALRRGVLIAAAGGNDGELPTRRGLPHYPAAHRLPGLLAVAALGPLQPEAGWSYASFSTLGEYLDIAAPGTGLQTGGPTDRYWLNMRGSSFAAPQVAGALALGLGSLSTLSSPADRASKTLDWLMRLALQPSCSGNVSRPRAGTDVVCSVLRVSPLP